MEDPMPAATAKAPVRSRRDPSVVRVDRHTNDVLADLVRETGEAKKKLLAQSVELLRRQVTLQAMCEGYRQLRANPEAWAAEQTERDLWQSADMDGLDD
jgi:hypothetical protein